MITCGNRRVPCSSLPQTCFLDTLCRGLCFNLNAPIGWRDGVGGQEEQSGFLADLEENLKLQHWRDHPEHQIFCCLIPSYNSGGRTFFDSGIVAVQASSFPASVSYRLLLAFLSKPGDQEPSRLCVFPFDFLEREPSPRDSLLPCICGHHGAEEPHPMSHSLLFEGIFVPGMLLVIGIPDRGGPGPRQTFSGGRRHHTSPPAPLVLLSFSTSHLRPGRLGGRRLNWPFPNFAALSILRLGDEKSKRL